MVDAAPTRLNARELLFDGSLYLLFLERASNLWTSGATTKMSIERGEREEGKKIARKESFFSFSSFACSVCVLVRYVETDTRYTAIPGKSQKQKCHLPSVFIFFCGTLPALPVASLYRARGVHIYLGPHHLGHPRCKQTSPWRPRRCVDVDSTRSLPAGE